MLNLYYKLTAKCIYSQSNQASSVKHNSCRPNWFPKNKYRRKFDQNNGVNGLFTESLSSYLITIDFEKAFDLLDKKFIFQCLGSLNFGPDVFKLDFNILYNNVSSCVINNGAFSNFFPVNVRCKTGLSPFTIHIFIAVETLALQIRNNKLIKVNNKLIIIIC